MTAEQRLDIPPGIEQWIEEATHALDREGSTDWDDTRRIAETVAVHLWNYLSEGLIPSPLGHALVAAARDVMAEWDALGPTGTESTIGAHRRLRDVLAALPAHPDAD